MQTLEEIKQKLLQNGFSKVIIKKDKIYGHTLWGYKQLINYQVIHYVDRHGTKQIYKRRDSAINDVVVNEGDTNSFDIKWYI